MRVGEEGAEELEGTARYNNKTTMLAHVLLEWLRPRAGLQDIRESAHLRTPSLHVEPFAPQMPPQQTSLAPQQMLPHFNDPCAQHIPL